MLSFTIEKKQLEPSYTVHVHPSLRQENLATNSNTQWIYE